MGAVSTQGMVTLGKEKKGGDRDNNNATLSLLESVAAADKARAAHEEEEV